MAVLIANLAIGVSAFRMGRDYGASRMRQHMMDCIDETIRRRRLAELRGEE